MDGDDEPGTRRMFDKRTLRKMYSSVFCESIQQFQEQQVAGVRSVAVPALPPGGTAVYLRKRQLFPKEVEESEYDIITPLPKGGCDVGGGAPEDCWAWGGELGGGGGKAM